MSGKRLCESAVGGTGSDCQVACRQIGGSLTTANAGGSRAKEATVSRAKGRTGVWRVTALLAGALTLFAGGEVRAYQPAGGAPVELAPVINTRAGISPQDSKALARSKLL